MNWRSIKKWTKAIYFILYGISMFALIGALSFMIWNTITDKDAVVNSSVVNSLSLTIGLVSLPGALVSLISLLDINSKKRFKATTHCPKCRHYVDLKLVED